MTKSKPPTWTHQKPARSADSAPVASSSSSRVNQLSAANRAISETTAFSQTQGQGHPVSVSPPKRPTLPSRRGTVNDNNTRPHPYKHARPPSVPRIAVKRETTATASKPPTWTHQKPARSADSVPVASSSSSRVTQLSAAANRAISETTAFSQQTQGQGRLVSVSVSPPKRPTLPSRRTVILKDNNARPHPYKHARPPSVPRIAVKRETTATSVESDSAESNNNNWLDVEMMKPDPEETKRGFLFQINFLHLHASSDATSPPRHS